MNQLPPLGTYSGPSSVPNEIISCPIINSQIEEQNNLEEWAPANGQVFSDFETFEALLITYAEKKGFKLSRRSSELIRGESTAKSRIVWQCQHSGVYRQSTARSTRKTCCQFTVRIAWQKVLGHYKVGKVVLDHNHPLNEEMKDQMNSGRLTANSPNHIPLSLPRSASSIHLTGLSGLNNLEADDIFRETQYTRRTENMRSKLERLVPLACQSEENYLVVMQLLDRVLDKIDPQSSFYPENNSHSSMTPMLSHMNLNSSSSGFLPPQPLSGSTMPLSVPKMSGDIMMPSAAPIVDYTTITMPGPIK